MLLEFTVGNYKSFNSPVTFSMLASTLKEHQVTPVFEESKYKLLKSAIIFGANASGKSNLFKAIGFMKNFVLNSAKQTRIMEKIAVDHFKLGADTEENPSVFEMIFLIDGIQYRYGFQANRERVIAEWLFFVPSTKEAKLFIREGKNIDLGIRYKEGQGLADKTRENALFLSVVAQFNGEISLHIIKWFKNINIISGLDDTEYRHDTIKKLNNTEFKKWALKYLEMADINIVDIEILPTTVKHTKLVKELQQIVAEPKAPFGHTSIKLHYQKYDKNNKKISLEVFDLDENESKGMQKILFLAGPFWDVLKNGKILIIDEFDARLHHRLTHSLAKLFNSPIANTRKAQFILGTYDTTLLRNDLFRRDQVWFIEKDRYGVSELYSLAEYKISDKVVRKDASFDKSYLLGKYGAVPIPGDFEELFEDEHGQ